MEKVDKQKSPYDLRKVYSFGEKTAAEYPIKNTVGNSKTILGSKSASSKDEVYNSYKKTNPIK
jgi:hypothetical protein